MRISTIAAHKAQMLLFESPEAAPVVPPEEIDPRPEIVCFRGQTLAIIRHYFELSSQVGRLPSLLGREFFRARVSHHSIPSFEDQAVFSCDVERCLARLSDHHAEVVTLVGLHHFSVEEVAEMLHRSHSAFAAGFGRPWTRLPKSFCKPGSSRKLVPTAGSGKSPRRACPRRLRRSARSRRRA